MTEPVLGRRERKKAATRQAIADAAIELFLARGYDAVGIRDIADAADVSTTTLFKHFPGKEALVFDQDAALEAELVAAVRGRGDGVVEALREHVLASSWPMDHPRWGEFANLIDTTPALRDYADRMWTRHAAALGDAIADEVGADRGDPSCVALARFVLDVPALVHGRRDPRPTVDAAFDILTRGWHPPVRPRSS